MIPDIFFNFETPQTDILGNHVVGSGYSFITINLTAHNLLYGYDEDVLIQSIIQTINHEIMHAMISEVCVYGDQEPLVAAIDKYVFGHLKMNCSNWITQRQRYKMENIEGYG